MLALPPLVGADPDEALTDVGTQGRGSWSLEQRLGAKPSMPPGSYFNEFAFQSISTTTSSSPT